MKKSYFFALLYFIVMVVFFSVQTQALIPFDTIEKEPMENLKMKIDNNQDDLIDKNSPIKYSSLSLSELKESFSVSTNQQEVKFPKKRKNDIVIKDRASTKRAINCSLPTSFNFKKVIRHKNRLIYQDDKNPIVLEAIEGGFRQTLIVNVKKESHIFELDFSKTELLEKLVFATDASHNADGSILLLTKTGETIGAIMPPLAIDANGKNVKTYYKIEGKVIRQVILPTEETSYPLVADPTTFTTYFANSKWKNRGGKYPLSLSLTPTFTTRISFSNATLIDSWNKLYTKHKNDKNWSNTAGMYNQYVCHFHFAKIKPEFNLEPKRPYKDYLGTVLDNCNPY